MALTGPALRYDSQSAVSAREPGTMGLRGKVEAVIYAAEEPVTLAQLAALFGVEALGEAVSEEEEPAPEAGTADNPEVQVSEFNPARRAARARDRRTREALRALVDELIAEYDRSDRGMEIREIAGGYRIATKPEYHDAVRAFAKSLKPPMKLSLPALETLAVIAYKQPVTAPEISEIRGVDSGGVLGSLIGRKLVTTAGRKQVVGRPILYKTTKDFLLRFGLKDLNELPSMEEFEKIAGELQALSDEPEEPAPLLPPAFEYAGPGEKPRLGPLPIEVSVEESEAPGLSVNRSGIPVPDDAARAQEGD